MSTFLNKDIHAFLLVLEKARVKDGLEWVSSQAVRHIPNVARREAQKRGYVEGRGATYLREYKLLPAGYTALADNAAANMDMMPEIKNGFVPVDEDTIRLASPLANGSTKAMQREKRSLSLREVDAALRASRSTPTEIVVAPPPKKNHARTQACVRAIDILSEFMPEVADLVDTLEKLERRAGHDD